MLFAMLSLVNFTHSQHHDFERPEHWKDLAYGGRFMDRFEPMPILGERTSDTWGVDAVKPRDILNGIEETEWSYWGGNIVQNEDGKFHMFVCRWPENHPKGHMAWRGSEVVRAVSDNRFGPYKFAQVIGAGHNPEVYRLPDGRYVCYVIGAYWLGKTIEGLWEKKEFEFDARDRKIMANLSNITFTPREDGSFLAVNRGGGIWISRDGLATWEQVTQGSNYPKIEGRFEDPVVWRTQVQFHMIVNDWFGRIAYKLRSKDGVHWKVDSGEAYKPGIAVYEDGEKDDWYKYERIKIFQDKHRRAVQANFAVIDYNKHQDLPNDIHSSKNISIPLTPGRLIILLNKEKITQETSKILVRIEAEHGFDPHKDIDFSTLHFGAPEVVDFGGGCRLLKTEKDGKDLIAIFAGKGNGFADHNFAGKLLGRTINGKLMFGYCRLPWIEYIEAILTARAPEIVGNGANRHMKIEVSNHGQVKAGPSEVRITAYGIDGDLIKLTASCPSIAPYEKTVIDVSVPEQLKDGKDYTFEITTGLPGQEPLVYTTKR